MTINISNIKEDLKENLQEILHLLNIKTGNDGYKLNAIFSDKFSVTFKNKEFTIKYPHKNLFFRGLLLIKRYKDLEFSISEEFPKELGIMVDCSRNAVKKVETLKRFISYIALLGYNQLYLYTEDTYEIKDEPYFGYMRGRYTENELKEIDDFAYSLGVEVIPCIQTLAHLNGIFRWKEFQKYNDLNDILLVDNEKTYILIEKMIKSISSCFRTKKIHIGMDEAHMAGRGKYEDIHGGNNERKVILTRHLKKVVEIAKKYSLSPMIWSDMIYRSALGGFYGEEKFQESLLKKEDVPSNLRLVYWDYNGRNRYDNTMKNHFLLSDNISFALGCWNWLGFTPHNSFSIEEGTIALKNAKKNNIDNIMITLWGDCGAECSLFASLPSIYYLVEYCYGNTTGNVEFFKDIFNLDFADFMNLDLLDIKIHSKIKNVNNPSKYMLYNDFLGGVYDFLSDGNNYTLYSEYEEKLNISNKNEEFSYIFETQIALCKIMKYKMDIGRRTRDAYKKDDRIKLHSILLDYDKIIKALDVFHEKLSFQWFYENKSFGFEVQDLRLGGLKTRALTCKNRLKDYLKGNISRLEELEQTELRPYEELADSNDFTACQVSFKDIYTVNIL